jgi:hypothetical protein
MSLLNPGDSSSHSVLGEVRVLRAIKALRILKIMRLLKLVKFFRSCLLALKRSNAPPCTELRETRRVSNVI